MTIKLGTLIQTKDFLQELSGLKLKAKDAFKIISAIKKIGAELAIYEEAKTKIITEHGTKAEDGSVSVEPNTEAYDLVLKELNELAMNDVELAIDKVSIDALGDNEIEMYKLMALEYIFEI